MANDNKETATTQPVKSTENTKTNNGSFAALPMKYVTESYHGNDNTKKRDK